MKMLEKQISEMLDQLAQKLGVASSKVWEWSLLQIKVEMIQTGILSIIAIVLTIILARLMFKTYQKQKIDCYEDETEAFLLTLLIYCVPLIVIAIIDISAILRIYEIPTLVFNPEYAAFKNIVKQLGELK